MSFFEGYGFEDAFGKMIADSTTNVLDLAGHYPYSPERWRLFVDGSRVFPEYGSVAQYSHAGDYHELQPAAGETVTMESAERPRYVVQYELAATWAFAVNQSLATGDSIRVGLYDGTDGWYMEHTGAHDDDTADFVLERESSEVYRREDVDIHYPVTDNARLKLETGWYDITGQIWERSYHNSVAQKNPLILDTSKPDGTRGSKTGNLPIHFSVTASGSTSNLVLEAGSAAQINLGKTVPFTRGKIVTETVNVPTANTWVPLFAVRADPERSIVNTQLVDVAATEFTGNADIEVLAVACDPSKVLDGTDNQLDTTDFSTPAVTSTQNSVIESTTNVAKFPDSTGTPVTSTDDPGGFQVGHDSLYTGGGNTVTENAGALAQSKRPIYGRDVVVFLANAGGTGDVTLQYRTEQDW